MNPGWWSSWKLSGYGLCFHTSPIPSHRPGQNLASQGEWAPRAAVGEMEADNYWWLLIYRLPHFSFFTLAGHSAFKIVAPNSLALWLGKGDLSPLQLFYQIFQGTSVPTDVPSTPGCRWPRTQSASLSHSPSLSTLHSHTSISTWSYALQLPVPVLVRISKGSTASMLPAGTGA